jgi:hypothetical protein
MMFGTNVRKVLNQHTVSNFRSEILVPEVEWIRFRGNIGTDVPNNTTSLDRTQLFLLCQQRLHLFRIDTDMVTFHLSYNSYNKQRLFLQTALTDWPL